MYTFVETYSLEGKTIYLFITSGSRPIGSSEPNLEKAAKAGNWKKGMRFTTAVSNQDILNWIKD